MRISKSAQVMLGAAYRTYVTITSWMGVDTKRCSHVIRGGNRQPITTCVGEIINNLRQESVDLQENKKVSNNCYTRVRYMPPSPRLDRIGLFIP